ncbi:Carbohydrate-selective porin, OprB family protein [Sphingomonas sp. RIT328]|nr:Carbohydrate-selective porin, OprB family protein [Sphingomonas sp. RIT328]
MWGKVIWGIASCSLAVGCGVGPAAAQDLAAGPATVPPPQQQEESRGDSGIRLALGYTGEGATNVRGGLHRDAAYAGQVYLGVDADLGRLAGVDGGTLHLAVTDRHGSNLSAIAIGNNTSVQEIWGTQNVHLAILTYEQRLLHDRLTVEAGRSQANLYFLNAPVYCQFQTNSACGNPTFIFKVSNFTYFPASSWMARARLSLGDTVYAHAGVFEVNPDRRRPGDHGIAFGTGGATGVVIPYELGIAADGASVRRPHHYAIGGWLDHADYDDPLRDDQGGIAITSGRPVAIRHGRSGWFARFDQMLTRPDSTSLRGLTLFGVAMTNIEGRTSETHFLELGLSYAGLLPGRERDTLGFVINDQRFSDLALGAMRAARRTTGGSAEVSRHQYMMELDYGAQLGPAVRLSPNLQYIVHPDQSGAPFRPRDIPDALVLGLKFTVDAPAWLVRPAR